MEQAQLEALIAEAEAARGVGDEPRARSLLEQAAGRARELFLPEFEAQAMLGLGELRLVDGDESGARGALEEAVARAVEGGVPLVEAEAHYALAVLAFDAGRSKDGHDALLEAMALYRQLEGDEARRGLARSVRTYGEHIGVLGSPAEAREALRLARAMFADLGDDAAVAGIDEDLSLVEEYSR